MTYLQFKITLTIVLLMALLCGVSAVVYYVVGEDSKVTGIVKSILYVCLVFFSICAVVTYGAILYDWWIKP